MRQKSMSHICWLIWSQLLNTLVVIAETVQSLGKGSNRKLKPRSSP